MFQLQNSLQNIARGLKILYLFTLSDFKTILLPIVLFAHLYAPLSGMVRIEHTIFWVWLHLLQFCVSNQSLSVMEDTRNKPWRPIPAQMICVNTARSLRWFLLAICILVSELYGVRDISLVFAVGIYLHNEAKLDSHWLTRNILNALGYATFDLGACAIARGETAQWRQPLKSDAFVVGVLIVLTTIHAQDFPDEEGDKMENRKTIPIVMPRAGRISMLISLPAWSIMLTLIWSTSQIVSITFISLGTCVGSRFIYLSSADEHRRTYKLYNIWLAIARIIPLFAQQAVKSKFL